MTNFELYRIILPVTDIEEAASFYSKLFQQDGELVSYGRHYFKLGKMIIACLDSKSDGREAEHIPNPEYIYFAVDDLNTVHHHAKTLPFKHCDPEIKTRPWGETSFYTIDPWGNKLCFVQSETRFLGGKFIP